MPFLFPWGGMMARKCTSHMFMHLTQFDAHDDEAAGSQKGTRSNTMIDNNCFAWQEKRILGRKTTICFVEAWPYEKQNLTDNWQPLATCKKIQSWPITDTTWTMDLHKWLFWGRASSKVDEVWVARAIQTSIIDIPNSYKDDMLGRFIIELCPTASTKYCSYLLGSDRLSQRIIDDVCVCNYSVVNSAHQPIQKHISDICFSWLQTWCMIIDPMCLIILSTLHDAYQQMCMPQCRQCIPHSCQLPLVKEEQYCPQQPCQSPSSYEQCKNEVLSRSHAKAHKANAGVPSSSHVKPHCKCMSAL